MQRTRYHWARWIIVFEPMSSSTKYAKLGSSALCMLITRLKMQLNRFLLVYPSSNFVGKMFEN